MKRYFFIHHVKFRKVLACLLVSKLVWKKDKKLIFLTEDFKNLDKK